MLLLLLPLEANLASQAWFISVETLLPQKRNSTVTSSLFAKAPILNPAARRRKKPIDKKNNWNKPRGWRISNYRTLHAFDSRRKLVVVSRIAIRLSWGYQINQFQFRFIFHRVVRRQVIWHPQGLERKAFLPKHFEKKELHFVPRKPSTYARGLCSLTSHENKSFIILMVNTLKSTLAPFVENRSESWPCLCLKMVSLLNPEAPIPSKCCWANSSQLQRPFLKKPAFDKQLTTFETPQRQVFLWKDGYVNT